MPQLEEWLARAATGARARRPDAPRLLVLCGAPGVGKSTAVRVLANELGFSLVVWRDRPVGAEFRRWSADPLERVSYESQLDAFRHFLHRSSSYPSLPLVGPGAAAATGRGGGTRPRGSSTLILVEELPHCRDDSARRHMQRTLARFIHRSVAPAVLILSDGRENAYSPTQLRRLLSGAPHRASQTSQSRTLTHAPCPLGAGLSGGRRVAAHDDRPRQHGGRHRHAARAPARGALRRHGCRAPADPR